MPDKPATSSRRYRVVEEVSEEKDDKKKEPITLETPVVKKEEKTVVPDKPETPEPLEEKQETPAPLTENRVSSFSMMDVPKESEEITKEEKREETSAETHDEVPAPVATATAEEETPAAPDSDVSSKEIQEWLENVRPETDVEPEKKSGGLGRFIAIAVIVLILVALGGGIYYYRANVEGLPLVAEKEEPKVTQTQQEPQETAVPTPTEVAVDLSKYKVQVLNGSGVSGEAGKAQGYLEGVGFKDLKTGNASSFGATSTQVAFKKDIPDEVFTKVKGALDAYYVDVTKSDKPLDDKSQYDIVITVGKKK